MTSPEDDPLRKLPLVSPPEPGEKRAAWWQITIAAVGAIAIVYVFLWGINNQRDETSGQQTTASQPTPATPHGDNQAPSSNAPATTGQSNNSDQEAGAQKENTDKQSGQQPTSPPQNGKPGDTGGQSQQPRGQ
jgi:hypothetical protein